MPQAVKVIMTSLVASVSLDCTLDSAFRLIQKTALRSIPVIDEAGKCFGIIRCDDLIRWHDMGYEIGSIQAFEFCSLSIIEVQSGMALSDAANLMLEDYADYLIVSCAEEIIGTVSLADVLECYLLAKERR